MSQFIIRNAAANAGGLAVGASGNAAQRRKLIRQWKRRGFKVRNYWTGAKV